MVEGEGGNIIIDTSDSTYEASEIYKRFKKLNDNPITAIIYTHNHGDHTFGAAHYLTTQKERPLVIAHESTDYYMQRILGIINPIDLERFKDNLKTSLIETGLSYSESSDLTFEIIITTKDKVQTDRMNHYYSRYYWDNYYFRDDIRTITENILRVNLKDNTADKTLWTVVTVWRDGSSKAPTSEDGSNIIVDEIMLSFL